MTKYLDERVFYSLLLGHESKPLRLWNKKIRAGHINQLRDNDLRCYVLEIFSKRSPNTYITCPADPKNVLHIPAPFLHLTVKNLERSFILDVLIKDDRNVERRFRVMTKRTGTELKPYICRIPLTLEKGWNEVIVPLKEYTRKAFGTRYVETLKVQMHATCRVQRLYFSHKPTQEGFQLR